MDNHTRFLIYVFLIPCIVWLLGLFFKSVRKFTIGMFNLGIIGAFFFFLFYGLSMISVSLLFNLFVIHYESAEPVVKENVAKIASLNLNRDPSSSVGGSFILGTGSANVDTRTEVYFYYYTQDENGRYKLDKINAGTVLIDESNEVESCIKTTSTYNVSKADISKLGEFLGFKEETKEYLVEDSVERVIYIPEGSVIQSYNPSL